MPRPVSTSAHTERRDFRRALHTLLALTLLLTWPLLTHAAMPSMPSLPADSLHRLAHSATWHALLHYQPAGLLQEQSSQIDDARFFLAPEGKQDPLAELRATLAAFYQPPQNPDQHAVCRFPARWQWLAAELTLPAPAVTPDQCSEFRQWRDTIQPDSVTLVFASAYLNSPSSMFGHTFLRIDPANVATGSTWLSYAVNFGAQYSPQDNSLFYAWKGVFGGYPGFFSLLRYHEKINEYNRIENRDLWEYRLNLTPAETRFMVSHLWELRDIHFDYFFFDENCSYRLLELLEVARPGIELTDGFGARAIPVDTVRVVQQAGLVQQVEYRAASATELQFQADQLDAAQQQLAWQLAHRQRALDDPALTALPAPAQGAILRVAYQHLRHKQEKSARDPQQAQHSLDLLKALHRLNTGEPPSSPRPPQPDSGHATLLAGLAGGRSDSSGVLDLRLRASYHDLTDRAQGYLDGAAINIGELQLRQREEDSLQIELLNFVEIKSHAPQNRFFTPLTWRVQAGFERVYGENDDALAARVNGGAGITRAVGGRHLLYGMGMMQMEYNALLRDNLAAGIGALAGGLFFTPLGTLQLENDYYRFSDGHERSDLSLTHNLPLGINDAVRLRALHRKQMETRFDEISLEYRHYY